MRNNIIIFILLVYSFSLFASDTASVFKKRKIFFTASSAAFTAGTLTYLNQVWYKQYKASSFHTFNDNTEWLQMDKCGHMVTTYKAGKLMMDAMEWSGFKRTNKILIGGLSGLAYMSAIEVMDGYSSGWGFSWGDMAANSLGSGLVIGQEILWNEQRIQFKYSYIKSDYRKYNPNLLGDDFPEPLLKDYNAQTYWMSINPGSFMKSESRFPKWLNIAIGYGADGMIGAFSNPLIITDATGNNIKIKRYRQYYLSLDADFTKLKIKSKFLRTACYVLNFIKIPFPNIELSEGKVKANYF